MPPVEKLHDVVVISYLIACALGKEVEHGDLLELATRAEILA